MVAKISGELGCTQAILVLIFGVRSFDMFSDWAFFSISLRKSGAFALAYNAAGGNHEEVWRASLAFCILGSVLYVPDLWGFYQRVDGKATAANNQYAAAITGAVFFFEDMSVHGHGCEAPSVPVRLASVCLSRVLTAVSAPTSHRPNPPPLPCCVRPLLLAGAPVAGRSWF